MTMFLFIHRFRRKYFLRATASQTGLIMASRYIIKKESNIYLKSSLGRRRGRTTAFNILEYGAECLNACINAHALAQRERVWRTIRFSEFRKEY